MREQISDLSKIEKIVLHTSHHTHYVIGTGANDPQKMDPKASRETLDHSIMYIFAVALQDGTWHHVDSYAPKRAARRDTVALWHKIETQEDAEWTKRYHSRDPDTPPPRTAWPPKPQTNRWRGPASPPATPRCARSGAPATTCTTAATTSSTSPTPASSRSWRICWCTARCRRSPNSRPTRRS